MSRVETLSIILFHEPELHLYNPARVYGIGIPGCSGRYRRALWHLHTINIVVVGLVWTKGTLESRPAPPDGTGISH